MAKAWRSHGQSPAKRTSKFGNAISYIVSEAKLRLMMVH